MKMALQGKHHFCPLAISALVSITHPIFSLGTDPTNPLLYKFSDALVTPDPFYTKEYAAQHKGKKTTIVIDNGTSQGCPLVPSAMRGKGVGCEPSLPGTVVIKL